MKAKVFGIDGKETTSIELPKVFETEYKPRVIKRAVQSIQTARLQAKGADPRAGLKTTAVYIGMRGKPTPMRTINTDKARLPRTKNRRYLLYGQVRRVTQAVGGRTPHAPKAWKVIFEKINKKEKQLGLKSAIAASTMKDLVETRFVFDAELPIIVEDKFEATNKTQKVVDILTKLGVGKDLENAKGKIRRRSGRGKIRGRTRKIKKSVLIVTGENSPVLKASRNLPGVEAVTANSLNAELLAPGTEAGRLVVWTTGAINALDETKAKKEVKTAKKVVKKKIVKKRAIKKVVKKKTTKK